MRVQIEQTQELELQNKQEEISFELINPATGEIIDVENLDIDNLHYQWHIARELQKKLKNFMDRVEALLITKIEQPVNTNTVHLETQYGKLKIQFKESEKYDEEKINEAGILLGDKLYELFKIEYKPRKKELKKFFATNFSEKFLEEAKRILREAKQTVSSKPSISEEKWNG